MKETNMYDAHKQRGVTMVSVMLMTVSLMTLGLLAVRSSTRDATAAGQLVARERALLVAQAAVDLAAAEYMGMGNGELDAALVGYNPQGASCTDPCGDCIPEATGYVTGQRNEVLDGTAGGSRQLVLNLLRVQEVQRLGQVGLADALAFARADALRPAEDVEEVAREVLVRQHDGPVRRMLVGRQAAEDARGRRHMVDRVEQHLGWHAPRIEAGERLLVVLVELVGNRAELVGPALDDHLHEVLQVELVVHQLLGEGVKQLRV